MDAPHNTGWPDLIRQAQDRVSWRNLVKQLRRQRSRSPAPTSVENCQPRYIPMTKTRVKRIVDMLAKQQNQTNIRTYFQARPKLPTQKSRTKRSYNHSKHSPIATTTTPKNQKCRIVTTATRQTIAAAEARKYITRDNHETFFLRRSQNDKRTVQKCKKSSTPPPPPPATAITPELRPKPTKTLTQTPSTDNTRTMGRTSSNNTNNATDSTPITDYTRTMDRTSTNITNNTISNNAHKQSCLPPQ